MYASHESSPSPVPCASMPVDGAISVTHNFPLTVLNIILHFIKQDGFSNLETGKSINYLFLLKKLEASTLLSLLLSRVTHRHPHGIRAPVHAEERTDITLTTKGTTM